MQKIIIIGATSGIGRELARLYAGAGNLVGVTGRRQELLYTLQLEYPNHIITECFDATSDDSPAHLESLSRKLGGLDLLIYNAGWGDLNETLDWTIDRETVDINVNGFLMAISRRSPPSPGSARTLTRPLMPPPKASKASTSKGSTCGPGS
jgi:NADP-dependent 3-hydroxy acid dehydrogenase YdfG